MFRIASPIYHHTLAPNYYGASTWGKKQYTITTNDLGFKDSKLRKVSKVPNGRRIVFIGDSLTEGVGFSFEETFTGIVKLALESKNIEVLNAAVASYSPTIYYRKIKKLINQGYKFDYLYVFLDISDIQDEALFYSTDDNGNVIMIRQGDLAKIHTNNRRLIIKNYISDHLYLTAKFIQFMKRAIFGSKTTYRSPRDIQFGLNDQRSLWTNNEKLFNEYGREGLKRASSKLRPLRKSHEK